MDWSRRVGVEGLEERLAQLSKRQASRDSGIIDLIAALDARLRVIEARLGIEAPTLAMEHDPLAALESGAIEESETAEDGAPA